ncbi:hypothetical protein Fcan01_01521 [Folsomia candida]|uniref:Uncharacterized protein n=1 Tax=Folsomia candida TaxID=158441 RepID=A0A226EYN0_FOLCA|nr:hypothetical protein Fcan01_01521 [Folsomia candida]
MLGGQVIEKGSQIDLINANWYYTKVSLPEPWQITLKHFSTHPEWFRIRRDDIQDHILVWIVSIHRKLNPHSATDDLIRILPTPKKLFSRYYFDYVKDQKYNQVRGRYLLHNQQNLVKNDEDLLFWTESSFSSLTCSSIFSSNDFGFDAYYRPYDGGVWVSIGILITIVSLCAVFRAAISEPTNFLGWFVTGMDSATLLICAVIDVIPNLDKTLLKVRVLRIVWPMWIIFCIILSNGYKGIVVNDLIAPLTQQTPQTLRDVMDNKFRVIYSDPAAAGHFTSHDSRKFNETRGTQVRAILSNVYIREVYIPYFISKQNNSKEIETAGPNITERQFAALTMCESSKLEKIKKCYESDSIANVNSKALKMLREVAMQVQKLFKKNPLYYLIQSLEWLSTQGCFTTPGKS